MLRLLAVAVLLALPTMSLKANQPLPKSLVIARGSGMQMPKQPQAVVADDGNVHLVYGIGNEVYYCQSSDGGSSFSQPTVACSMPNMSLGKRRGPRISATKDFITISVIGGAQGKGRDGDINVWRSTDQGKTWQGPVHVNDEAASAREGLHAMAADGAGNTYCTWLDLRSKKTELYAAHSADGGATWSKNVLVYRSPSGSICECCHPSIAILAKAVHVLFRNSLDGNRDMFLVSSTDGGQFNQATQLGSEHWQLNACPMDGGMLSIEGDGTVSTVWRRGGLVFATRGQAADETLLGRGEQPWIASTADDSLAVWTAAREEDLFITSLKNIEPRKLDTKARDPVIATPRSGQGPIIVCYESQHGDESSIAVQALAGITTSGKSR